MLVFMVAQNNYYRPLVLLVLLAFTNGLNGTELEAQCVTDRADYFSFVNWDYRHRNDLIGWKHSTRLIQASLKDWGYSMQVSRAENSSVDGLQQFQQKILSRSSSGLKLIYLASHQTPSGQIEFPNQTKAFWSEAFVNHGMLAGDPSILILDVCHAGVIPQVSMNEGIPFDYLLAASAANEETYELRMFARRPVDFRRRYPAAVEWMKDQLGSEWEGQVSFTGFFWVRQFLQWPQPPRSSAEWREFLRGMEQEASSFTSERSRYLSSTLKVWE
ncbi:MAG: hypothetical protein AAGH72_10515 [Verrucomicrobiota bacterium]